METLSRNDVVHVAGLARLSPSEVEIEHLRQELGAILSYVEMLQQLDVEGVEPLAHPLSIVNRLDEDQIGESLSVTQLLNNAASVHERFLKVPKIIAESSES